MFRTTQNFSMDPRYSHHIIIEKEGYESQHYILNSLISKKLNYNPFYGYGIGLIGIRVGLATGDMGIGFLTSVGATMLGYPIINLGSSETYTLSSNRINAKLKPLPHFHINY